MQKRHFVKLRVFPILLSFLSVFFILTIQVNAEGNNSYYPYVIPNRASEYTSFAVNNPDLINFFLSNSDVSTYISGHDYILYFPDVTSWRESATITVLVDPEVTAVPSLSESTSFTNTGFQVSGYTYSLGIYVDNGNYAVSSVSFYEPSTVTFLGSTSQDTFSGVNGFNDGSYYVNYPFLSTLNLYGLDDKLLLSIGNGNETPIGSIAYVPSADFLAYIGGTAVIPQKPNISQWNNNLSGFENVYQILGDLADTMEWGYVSLIDNIFSAIDNLGSQVRDWSQGIQTTINNGFVFLSNNLEEFFTPFYEAILDKLETITDVVGWFRDHALDNDGNFDLVVLLDYLFNADPDEISDLFENSTLGFLVSAVTNILQAVYFFIYSWFTITPTKVMHIPSCTFLGQEIGDFYVDFSWYDDYKTLGDGIISFFLVCGYAVWFVTRMVGVFRGTAPEVKEGLTVAHK